MSDSFTSEISEKSITAEESVYSGDILLAYCSKLRNNIPSIFDKFVNNESLKLEERFPEGIETEIAQNMVPSIMEGARLVVDNARGFLPKDPVRAVFWVFMGPLAKIGAHESEGRKALDSGEEYEVKELKKLNPIKSGESINLSKQDLKDVGRVVGELMANHVLANRDFSEIKANRGNLGRIRNAWAIESKDKLRLLDTVVSSITPEFKQ